MILPILFEFATVAGDPISQQIKWLRERGGFFSDKISHNGTLFANAPIQKGEEIMIIPTSIIITGGPEEDMCITARNILKEYNLGEESTHAPYIRYVFESFPHDQHPLAWSNAAANLFASIVGQDLEPQNLTEFLFENRCSVAEGDLDKEALAAAYRIVVSRGWEDILVPVFDLLDHRNGKYHNVDQKNSVHNSQDISVIAIRDISEGEMLYYSYNECNDVDCQGNSHAYVTPLIFADYGFVEQYPRRFNFATHDEEEHKIFEIDIDDHGVLQLNWISDPINVQEKNWFRGNLHRLYHMETKILQEGDKLVEHEKNLILEYYQAMVIALEVVISWETPRAIHDPKCPFDESHQDQTCHDITKERVYTDGLNDIAEPLNYQTIICKDYALGNGRVDSVDMEMTSQYQPIQFSTFIDDETGKKDTCLYLQDWIQTCTSFRPHYHEWLIHYPSSFLKEVNRVLFIGGGDNMALHEVLKYPTLELVVGLELDQQVVRSSFKYMRTQPHFDVDVVQWWFGDASKSLQILPEHYYGTFDLVAVDLHTYVIESIMVTKEHNIIDFAMLLLKPEGILTQNEDFVQRINDDFARYTVDLEFNDLPVLCQQSITIGSNQIDFSNAKRFDHGVDTIVYDTNAAGDLHAWWNYRHIANPRTKRTNMVKNQSSGNISMIDDEGGVVLVLEVEKVSQEASSSPSMSDIQDLIVRALVETNLTILSSSSYESESTFILLQEGYVTIRSFLDDSLGYYACDLYFWSGFDKQDAAKATLVTILGGQSSSFFRIVTTGMMPNSPKSLRIPADNDDSDYQFDAGLSRTETNLLETSSFQMILNKMPSMMRTSTEPTFAVICAIDIVSCRSLDFLQQTDGQTVIKLVLVKSCSNEDSLLRDTKCEKEVIAALNTQGKIDGIVIDPLVTLKMGQVLLEVFRSHKNREKILSSHYMILAPYAYSSGSWRKALMERFRTKLVIFNPTFHADISITDKETESTSSLNIFSTGNDRFYADLFDVIDNIVNTGKTSVRVNFVKGGILNYIPEFKPTRVATNSDYDSEAAQKQWYAQRPVGHQSVMQFEFERPHLTLQPGEKVLAKSEEDDEYTASWYMGKVLKDNGDHTYNIVLDTGEKQNGMHRHLIRKWEVEREVSVSDRVLVLYEEDQWYQGTVLDRLSDTEYRVHVHNGLADIFKMNKTHLIRRYEELLDVDDDARSLVSSNLLKGAMHQAMVRTNSDQQTGNVESDVYDGVEDGLVICLYWRKGSAILNWDGGRKLALNLATFGSIDVNHDLFRDVFLQSLQSPFLLSSHDHHPRGYGRVVNFKNDLSERPSINDQPSQ